MAWCGRSHRAAQLPLPGDAAARWPRVVGRRWLVWRCSHRPPGCAGLYTTAVVQCRRHTRSAPGHHGGSRSHQPSFHLHGECQQRRAVFQRRQHVCPDAFGQHRPAPCTLHSYESLSRRLCRHRTREHQCAHSGLLDDVCGGCERRVVGLTHHSGHELHAARGDESGPAKRDAKQRGGAAHQCQRHRRHAELHGQWSARRAGH